MRAHGETLKSFFARLRSSAETLNGAARPRIVRIVVKEVLIGDDAITIRPSTPTQQGTAQRGNLPPAKIGGPN
jgi:site-specific DNA recombinase